MLLSSNTMNGEDQSPVHGEKVVFSGSENPLVIFPEDLQSNSDGIEDKNSSVPQTISNTPSHSSVLRKPIPVTECQELPQIKKRPMHRPRQLAKQPSLPSLNLTIGNVSLSVV